MYRHRGAVILLWAMFFVTSIFFAPRLSDRLQGGGFGGGHTEAERVQSLMVHRFGVAPTTLEVVFDGGGLSARSTRFQDEERRALQGVRRLPEVSFIRTYAGSKDPHLVSRDGTKSYAVVGFDVSADRVQNLVDEVRERVRSDRLRTYVTGAPAVYLDIVEATSQDVRHAERFAFPFALVILLLSFGTAVAAGVPVAVGGVSVLISLAILYFVSHLYDLSVFVLSIATMLGLGLGIDYALFAVSRFREELDVRPVGEAVATTVATAGRSIFFSGSTVLIGLSGLLFFPFMFMRSIGIAGILVVFVSVAAAITLLPALLGILGHRVNALAVRRGHGAPGIGFWSRSARLVMRHPVLVLLGVAVVLGFMLLPVRHMRLGLPQATALPVKYESRVGDDILRHDFDYPRLNPVEIVATLPHSPTSARGLSELRRLEERISSVDGVSETSSFYDAAASVAGDYARKVASAREKARERAARLIDEETEKRLAALRAHYGYVPPGAEKEVRARVRDEVDRRILVKLPDLPAGLSTDGRVTPRGVANFLSLPQAKSSKRLKGLLHSEVSGDMVLIQATTSADPYSGAARDTVARIRSVDTPAGSSILVGGLSAGQKDFISSLYNHVPYAAGFVLGVTFVILFLTFRSLFIPLKAVLVNILSLSASFGAMVFVFQEGHFSGLLGFTPEGFIDATLPILMFCTVFGVSMDYEVFLLSRVREAYERGKSNTESVTEGVTTTAGIITSAAAIVIVVTGAFAFSGIVLTKAVGLGLAVAVFVDATIIRILLVPAAMRILGDWNWWPAGRRRLFKYRDKISS
ncbi:MMPL family transporter [Rubrobacter calidifluminis]|uniref:MMPL family transporter n=1 Tax=Rubrobacter calidifluminis TaxID=1392640 RepID=UPI002360F13B|nr:MMPL family transporter [Rubrobacter calidifluminis]